MPDLLDLLISFKKKKLDEPPPDGDDSVLAPEVEDDE